MSIELIEALLRDSLQPRRPKLDDTDAQNILVALASVRKELAKKDEEIKSFMESYESAHEQNIRLANQLGESEAERLEQARLLGMSGEREAKLLAKLAASQLREQMLCYALDHYQHGGSNYAKIAKEALSLPQDTSALEAMIAKAGEVMRERCIERTKTMIQLEVTLPCVRNEIRALPGVTLKDLK